MRAASNPEDPASRSGLGGAAEKRGTGVGHRLLLPNTTQVPNVILDRWMASMTGAKIKVVLYVVRRTFGFGRTSDHVSVRQMVDGIVKRDGTRLDYGTGLGRSTVIAAVEELTREGVLLRRGSKAPSGADRPAEVSLNMSYEATSPDWRRTRKLRDAKKVAGGATLPKKPAPPATDPDPKSGLSPSRSRTPRVQEKNPQNREGQNTGSQNPEAAIDRGRHDNGRSARPWQGLAAEVDLIPEASVGQEATRLAGQLTDLLDVRRHLAGKPAQLCVERRERDMLMRVALRVAQTEPAQPWPALCAAVISARKEEGGRR